MESPSSSLSPTLSDMFTLNPTGSVEGLGIFKSNSQKPTVESVEDSIFNKNKDKYQQSILKSLSSNKAESVISTTKSVRFDNLTKKD